MSDLRLRVLNKLAKDNGQDNWNCLKKSLAATGDGFAITYTKLAVDLALAEALNEVEIAKNETIDFLLAEWKSKKEPNFNDSSQGCCVLFQKAEKRLSLACQSANKGDGKR